MKLSKCSAIFFASACFLFQPLAHAQYSFTDLGAPLSGYANSTASGVNNKGEVVGICYNDILLSQAFLWTNGVFSALSLPGHNVTRAGRINDNGDIIGVATITALQDGYYVNAGSTLVHWNRNFPNTQFNPVAWPAGHYKNSFDYAYPSGINQNNQAAGSTILNQSWGDFWSNGNQLVYAGDLDQQVPAFWDNGIMTILAPPDLQPWDLFYGHAHDINDDGTIVGTMSRYSFIDSSRNGSFIFISQSGGPAEPLPGPFFYPFRINNAGDILCLSPEPDYLPSIYRNGTFIPLGTLDAGGGRLNPRSMNNSGQVVGDALNTVTGLYTAFLWQLDPVTGQSTIVDLNEVAAPEGWHLNAGNQITDSGVIVGSGTFEGQERAFMLTPAVIAVDANRDGEITFDGKDGTSSEKPFRFWLNDDNDELAPFEAVGIPLYDEEDDLAGTPDSSDRTIDCRRDLEDFTRIHIRTPAGFDRSDPNWVVKINFGNVRSGNPVLRLWRAVRPGNEYLTDLTVADEQLATPVIGPLFVERGLEYVLPPRFFDEDTKTAYLLFEGVASGRADFVVRFYKNEEKVAEGRVDLELNPIQEFYERYSVGEGNETEPGPLQALFKYANAPSHDEERNYVLLVLGWNVTILEKNRWAETTFKRLWHQGYKGRVGTFQWPCLVGGPLTYDPSDLKAYKSANELRNLLVTLNESGYGSRVRVLAHSQGNVVVGEALRSAGLGSGLVHTYVGTQAAVPARAYDISRPDNPRLVPRTPDVLAHFWRPGLTSHPGTWPQNTASYFHADYVAGTCGKFINFFNALDIALAGFALDQRLKPTRHANYFYHRGSPNFPNSSGFYKYNGWFSRPTLLNFPNDRYEIFVFAAQADSLALGAQEDVGGVFSASEQVDLQTNYGFAGHHRFHSGQFRSNIQLRGQYWKQLLESFDLD